MIPVHSRTKHNPVEDVWGDCYKCCIASILELSYEAVPHFYKNGLNGDPKEVQDEIDKWFFERGIPKIVVHFLPHEDDEGPAHVLNYMQNVNPNFYYVLNGQSCVSGVGHSVVCLGSEIVFDSTGSGVTHPDEADNLYNIEIYATPISMVEGFVPALYSDYEQSN